MKNMIKDLRNWTSGLLHWVGNRSKNCRWNPGNNWALSAMFIQELSTKHPADAGKRLGGVFFTQVRYRF
ncbi:MAG: hypothetical protein P8M80_05190 [Pirellulaceae bacterium]|nr:hypothetical protein [Pirellulaceae bacterium]